MNQNFNGTFSYIPNSNFTQPTCFQSGNYLIFPIQNLPLWNQQNNFYCTQDPVVSPLTESSIVKRQYTYPDGGQEIPIPQNFQEIRQNNKYKGINKLKDNTYEDLFKPPPQVSNKAKYFDPSNAPLVTSQHYFLIQKEDNEKVKQKRRKRAKQQYYNECDQPQNDSNPFITFRDRRIKKKYRRYIQNSSASIPFLEEEMESVSSIDVRQKPLKSIQEQNFFGQVSEKEQYEEKVSSFGEKLEEKCQEKEMQGSQN